MNTVTHGLPVICLMGPTASGKTPLAIELISELPCEIISVDSAQIYREMDIGTAKPPAHLLKIAPHRLIDMLDPSERYSAGQFRLDALRHIADIHAHGKIPLLVGGTMLYFRVLQQGIAALPPADLSLRATLNRRVAGEGIAALHAELLRVDPVAAKRIHPSDSQRIQRALEVYLLTGKTLTAFQAEQLTALPDHHYIQLALMPDDRFVLHQRIEQRFDQMLANGLLEEVERLYARSDLSIELPSIRSVGYRQAWQYFAGEITYDEMRAQAIAATRQLAKRQMTWLRSWPNVMLLDRDDVQQIKRLLHL